MLPLNPKSETAKINEGIALANLQKYDAAAALLNALARKDPDNAHIWYTLGLVYKNQGNSEESLAALQTATVNPARYFGLQETAGSVVPGQRADLVLLDANPLSDIANVRPIRAVIVAGRLLEGKSWTRCWRK